MASRKDNALASLTEHLSEGEKDFAAVRAELGDRLDNELMNGEADVGGVMGELTGQFDLALQTGEKEVGAVARKLTDKVMDRIIESYADLRDVGYAVPVGMSEVEADLVDPDQGAVLARRLFTTNISTPPVPEIPIDPLQGLDVVPIPVHPSPQIPIPGISFPDPPAAPQPPQNCFPAGPLDPLFPGRLICEKPGAGLPGVPGVGAIISPGTEEPPASCPAPRLACPAPVVNVTVRPVIDDGRSSKLPGDYPPQPDCPEPPVVNVEGPRIAVGGPVINLPDPVQVPREKLGVLPAGQGGGKFVKWDTDDACAEAVALCDTYRNAINNAAGGPVDIAAFGGRPFSGFVTQVTGVVQATQGPIIQRAWSILADFLPGSPLELFSKTWVGAWSMVRELEGFVATAFGESAACAMAPAVIHGWLTKGVNLTGVDGEYFLTPLKYEFQFMNPVYLPTQTGIDVLYLGDRISIEDHECYTKALGNLPHLHRMTMEEGRSRLRDEEWIDLFMRGKVDDDRLFREMRKLGWLDRSEAARKLSLREQLPPFTDIIRMMVRDTEDPAAVRAGELDTDFQLKFVGQLKEWAQAQGISEPLAQRYWRAHWEYPSPTQLYEMLHRLRPGEVPDNLAVTPLQVRDALKIDDKAPAWLDRLVAISYHPLTRTDAKRAYQLGVITKEELTRTYEDNGYSRTNAETLARFTEVEGRRWLAGQIGVWTLNKVGAAYKEGTISAAVALDKARQFLPDLVTAQQFLIDVDDSRTSERKLACLKALKRRYMVGEFDFVSLQGEMLKIIDDVSAAASHATAWECQRSSRRKEVPARSLCRWLAQGIITQAQYLTRLGNLGYTQDDAVRMLASCGQDIFEKEKARAIREAKQRLDEYRKRIAEAEKKYKELLKKTEELQKKLDNPREGG